MALPTLCLVTVGWADVSLANVAETFFLKRVGVEFLPIAWLPSLMLLVATSYFVGRVVAPRDHLRALPAVFIVLALGLVGLWGFLQLEVSGTVTALILVQKQFKMAALLVFWLVMGDLLHGRQAKRLYPPIIAGLTLGGIGGSFASGAIGRALSPDAVLVTTAGVLAVGALAALSLGQQRGVRLEVGLASRPGLVPVQPGAPGVSSVAERGAGLVGMWRESRLFRLLLLVVVLGSLAEPMLYFQFQYVVDAATTGEDGEARLMSLYASLRGWLYVAVLVIQLTVAGRLFRRVGVPLSASATPIVYVVAFLGLAVAMSLPIAIGALVATRLQGKAVEEPALKVLFTLLPEHLRVRATTLVNGGPVDRLGGALGCVILLGALSLGSVHWVSYVAIPIALGWLAIALMLWRAYPGLLLGAAHERQGLKRGDDRDVAELLDRATLRVLAAQLADPAPSRCQAAIDLVSDAEPVHAVRHLAAAAEDASPATRPLLVAALHRLMGRWTEPPVRDTVAARCLMRLLQANQELGSEARADLVQACGRLAAGDSDLPELDALLEGFALDRDAAVSLAARAALFSRARIDPSAKDRVTARELDQTIDALLGNEDAALRRTASEELRWLLLSEPVDDDWRSRLARMGALLGDPQDRAEAVLALADVAGVYPRDVSSLADEVVALCDDPEPRVRAAVLVFAGYAGRDDLTARLVEALGSSHSEESEAARVGLLALGPRVAKTLLVAHGFGRRSQREAILSIIRDLKLEDETLRELYEAELARLRETLVTLYVLSRVPAESVGERSHAIDPIVLQRFQERLDEGIRALLIFLTVLHDEERIAWLEPALRRSRGTRRRAILLEALESLLKAERRRLMPLLEEGSLELRVRALAAQERLLVPTFREASLALLEDPDELTRTLALATLPEDLLPAADIGDRLVPSGDIEDHPRVPNAVDIALMLREVPIFEHLSAARLMDLGRVMHEERMEAGDTVCHEGEAGDCMYLILEGRAEAFTHGTKLAEFGPKEIVGEMALFDGIERAADVICTTPVRLLRLDRDDLMVLMEELPSIAIGLCQALSRRIRDMNARA